MNLHEQVAAERARLVPIELAPPTNVSNFVGPYDPGRPASSLFSDIVSMDAWRDALAANNNFFTTISEWGEVVQRLGSMPDKPDYDPFRDENMKGLEDYSYQLGRARSPEQFRYLQQMIAADMDARRRFSQMGPMSQFIMGMASSLGPADMLPFASWPRGIVAAAGFVGGTMAAQSAVRHSLAITPGTIGDVGLEATVAALFAGGLRTIQRIATPEYTPAAARWARAADDAEAASDPARPAGPAGPWGPRDSWSPVGGLSEPQTVDLPPGWQSKPAGIDDPFVIVTDDLAPARPKGEAPRVIQTDDAGPGPAKHEPPRVLVVEDDVPAGAPKDQSFVIVEDATPAKARHEPPRVIQTDEAEPSRAGPASTPIDRPWVVYEDGTAAPIRGNRPVTAGDIDQRPWTIVPIEGSDVSAARQAPSAREVVRGWLDERPIEVGAVRARIPNVPRAADEAAGAVDDTAKLDITPAPTGKAPDDSSVGAKQYGSQVWRAEDSELAGAHGLEKIKLTPAARLLRSINQGVRDVATALVNHGMVLYGNVVGKASEQSVESIYYAMHAQRVTQTTQEWWRDFAGYAAARGAKELNTGLRTIDFMAARVGGRGYGASYKAFMQDVSKAVLDGGQHADPHIAAAAARFIKQTDELGREATDVGYWDTLYDMRVRELESRRTTATKAHDTEQVAKINRELHIIDVERQETLARGKPKGNRYDIGYLNRYWKHDQIEARRGELEAIFQKQIDDLDVRDPISGRPYTGKQAVDILLNIDELTGLPRPYVAQGGDAWAHSAKQQGFDWIPTKAVWEFIETDAEVLLRRYVRQIGIDIELTRRFGDPFLMKEISALASEGASRADLEDIIFLRNQLRGTGWPMDPHSLMTHSIQAAKYLSNMVLLGLQTVTAFTDLARPLMVEGVARTFGESYRALAEGMAGIKAWRKEASALGTAGEMVQSMRAHAFATGSDGRAGSPAWLSGLERAHSAFFMFNGIAPWTDTMKTWATIISSQRIMDVVSRIAARGPVEEDELIKLSTIGITQPMADRIAAQIDAHKVVMGKTVLPNVADWTDIEATRAFRTGLWQSVNRTIVTPGVADQARWMVEGTSWLPAGAAQLLSMYHNYGLALHQRLILAGVQGADANFIGGAMALVTLGYMVDIIRDEINTVGDRGAREKTTMDRIVSSIDRSGLMGYMANINNAIERLSLQTIGIRPTFGDAGFFERLNRAGNSDTALVGALGGLGPVGSWAGSLYRVVNGVAHDRYGWAEANAFRRMLPLQNFFWFDGMMDRVQEAYYVPAHEARAESAHRSRLLKIAAERSAED